VAPNAGAVDVDPPNPEQNIMQLSHYTGLFIICDLQCIPCGIAEIAFHTSQVSGLISFQTVPPHLRWEAVLVVTRPTKDYLHSSEISGINRENIEKVSSYGFKRTHVALLMPAQYSVHLPLRMSLLTG